MPVSLQDQLKKAGLLDDKKAKQLQRTKHKQEKLARKTRQPAADQSRLELERAQSEKIARDRQLNLEKYKQAEKNAFAAQIKQLIETNIVAREGEQKFNFTDAKLIKHIYVSQTQIEQLSAGNLAIVRQKAGKKAGQKINYVIVPMSAANRIEQLDASAVVFKALPKNSVSAEDDPYADYKIPDDLTW